MWFVYLLECSDTSLYCGITNNLEKRLSTHNSGKGAKYTRNKLPVKLVWFKECLDKSIASKEEYKIKKMKREDKLKLINGDKI